MCSGIFYYLIQVVIHKNLLNRSFLRPELQNFETISL
jgi:hypothetical protein